MALTETLPGCQQTSNPLSHAVLRLNLPNQTAQIQMSMTVNQGGEQDGLTMVTRWSLKPLSAELLKWSYGQYDTVGHDHCAIWGASIEPRALTLATPSSSSD